MPIESTTLDQVLETIRDFGARELPLEKRLALDRNGVPAEKLIRKLLEPEIGLHLLFVPAEHGGMGGGAHDLCRVAESLAALDLGVATSFLAIALGLDPLRVGGTPDQQARWYPRVAEEGLVVAYAVTEPEAGSDVAKVSTSAEATLGEGEGAGYRINGTKQFVTNGSIADLYTVLARTKRGLSFFMVEGGVAGLSAGPPEHKHGIRASDTAQVFLENVDVPADHLIGGREGQGLRQANEVFAHTRLMVAAMGLGAGEAALEQAISYSRERRQFGSLLCEKPGYTHTLILPHYVALQASRALIEEVSGEVDLGGVPASEAAPRASMAKLLATESATTAADAALQAFGGYGYIQDFEVEKIRRDVRITTIYEGTSEIQQSIIAASRWRELIRSRGQRYLKYADQVVGEGGSQLASALRHLVSLSTEARKMRLSSHGYFQLRLGETLAYLEAALALHRKALVGDREVLRLSSRIFAGEARQKVGGLAATFDLTPLTALDGKQTSISDLDVLATLVIRTA